MSTTRSVLLRCLSIAAALCGCATDVISSDEQVRLDALGPYDADAAPVELTSQALSNAAKSTGFVWANNPTASSYMPRAGYSYNYSASTNNVTRLGKGRYRVTMPGLSLPGNTQVVAYGGTSQRCALAAKPASGLRIDVDCFDYAGTLADAYFVVLYANHDEHYAGEMAYGTAKYSVAAGNPVITLQDGHFVSSISRQSPGYYAIKFDSSLGTHGTPFATAINANGNFCSIGNQSTIISQINVHCFDDSGASADTYFSFAYMTKPRLFGGEIAVARSTKAADSTVSGFYSQDWDTENVYFDYGSSQHTVSFDGGSAFGTGSSSALVTYFGNGAFWCKPSYWSNANDAMDVSVKCFDTTGANRNDLLFSVGAVVAHPQEWLAPL